VQYVLAIHFDYNKCANDYFYTSLMRHFSY